MEWVEYLVIFVFVALAIGLISVFVDAGPKKWAMIAAALGLGFIAVFFTNKRHRYNEEKLRKHNEEIKKLLSIVEDREKIVNENNENIEVLVRKRDELLNSAEVDQAQLDKINESIDARKKAHEAINKNIEVQENEIAKMLAERESREVLPDASEILSRNGVKTSRLQEASPVSDPSSQDDADAIVVRGFVMKGDVT